MGEAVVDYTLQLDGKIYLKAVRWCLWGLLGGVAGGKPREIHVYWTDHSVILGNSHSLKSCCNLESRTQC